ncbi:MAG TPA: RNA-binding domain-containing protein [Polyangiales bacterium]|nr:RNA-binding domain-containing protein [Polyangiales bacterium]
MLKEELHALIANGENSGVEFKRDDVRPEQLAREIVALANFQGGRVLLGVEDDGSISGIARADLETWVMDTVFSRFVHPWLLPFYEEVALDDGRRVAVISITQGTAKPYVLRHNGREEIYIRVGSTSRLATREQQARLFALGGLLHAETLPASGTRFGDLSLERLRDYLLNRVGDTEIPADQGAWERRLEGLGLMVPQDAAGSVCTIAGLALFGHRPRRSLPQAGVRWMAFAGVSKEYQALDDSLIEGPLVALLRDGSGDVLEAGLIERVVERMRPFVSTEAAGVQDSMRRERIWFYPIEAIREALLNALVHRDWTRLPEIEIVSYSDRLEIMSPGALQNSMTVEKMLAGQRSPRNPLLVEVMRDYGYVDARGMGVRRKIVPLVRAATGRDAVFEATEDFVRVVLPRRAQDVTDTTRAG